MMICSCDESEDMSLVGSRCATDVAVRLWAFEHLEVGHYRLQLSEKYTIPSAWRQIYPYLLHFSVSTHTI